MVVSAHDILKGNAMRVRQDKGQTAVDEQSNSWIQGRTQGGGVVFKSPLLELDILRKLYYLRKGNELFSHTFDLLICRRKYHRMNLHANLKVHCKWAKK